MGLLIRSERVDSLKEADRRSRHGRPSYHSLLVFDGRSKACLNAVLRPGNAHTAEGFFAFYRQAVSALSPGVKVEYVRMDKGFAGEDVYRRAGAAGRRWVRLLRWAIDTPSRRGVVLSRAV